MQLTEQLNASSGLSAQAQKTLTNTFWTVGGMLGILALSSLAFMGMKLDLTTALVALGVSIALIFAIFAFKNSVIGLVLLAGFAALQGLSLGPLLSVYLEMKNGALVVGSATGITALATFGCAAYAIVSKRDFSRLHSFLFAGLIVLILASLVGMFFPMPLLHVTISAVGAILFVGWLLYDVGSIVNGQQTNYITASLSIFLDVLNLFVHLLQLLGYWAGDD